MEIIKKTKKTLVDYNDIIKSIKKHEPEFYRFLAQYRITTKVCVKLANVINRSLSKDDRERFMLDQNNTFKHANFIIWLQEYDEKLCLSLQSYYFTHLSKVEKQIIKI